MKKQEALKLIREARTILETASDDGGGISTRDCIAVDILLQWAAENLQEVERGKP